MLTKYSEPMSDTYLREHCRYKIWKHSSGQFDKANVVAYCETVKDAKRLVSALSEYDKDADFSYAYELCADFIQLKDVDIEIGM